MIDKEDWVFRFENPTPNLASNWSPNSDLRKVANNTSVSLRKVARELARVKGEESPEAWYWYIGMAVTWLNQNKLGQFHGEDRGVELERLASLASHPTEVADKRRLDP